MPSCRISCWRSELGERDGLQEAHAENARLRAALETCRAHLHGKPVMDHYVMIKGEADPRNFPTLGQMIDAALG